MERLQKQTFPESYRKKTKNNQAVSVSPFYNSAKLVSFQLPGFIGFVAPQLLIEIIEHSLLLCLGSTALTWHYFCDSTMIVTTGLKSGGR